MKTYKDSKYLVEEKPVVELLPSGCCLLDCALGGGWAEGKVINVIGDTSTGKTLLAIEACANFARKYPNGRIRYNEVEAAFDVPYAESLGLPRTRIKLRTTCDTVENFHNDVVKQIELIGKNKQPMLYILDSLDGLTDVAEQGREIGEGTYAMAKAKQLSQIFRRLIRAIRKANITLIIISQIRANVGVSWGESYTRAGGKALDFYSTQIVYLAKTKRLKRTVRKVDRIVGVQIKALVKKNKVGPPFRECEFPLIFSFGMDDVRAGIDWLRSVQYAKAADSQMNTNAMTGDEYAIARRKITRRVQSAWAEIERRFNPTKRKYA